MATAPAALAKTYAIYVITDPHRRAKNIRKIGIHTGDKDKLRRRYRTPMPDHIIEHFHPLADKKECRVIEKELMMKYEASRVPNDNGTASEWANVTLEDVIEYIVSRASMPTRTMRTLTIEQVKELYTTERIQSIAGQRETDEEHVRDISEYITKHHAAPDHFIGQIALSFRKGAYHIIDGQHRLRAMKLMPLPDEGSSLRRYAIDADIRYGLSAEQERNMFTIINRSLPMPELLLHDGEKKTFHDAIRAAIQERYKESLSESTKPHIPNFNLSAAMEEISAKNIVEDLCEEGEVKTPEQFIAEIFKLNDHIGAILSAPRGITQYKKYASGATTEHTTPKLKKLLELIKNKSKGAPERQCYLALISRYRWTAFIGHIDRY